MMSAKRSLAVVSWPADRLQRCGSYYSILRVDLIKRFLGGKVRGL